MAIVAQGVNDKPQLGNIEGDILDLSDSDSMTCCVVEKGMASGEPSVLIVVPGPGFSVVVQTSLDKFLLAAHGMSTLAQTRWGWVQPEGYSTIMPPDKATRKALLEKIKTELEEWDEVDD